MLRQSVPSTGLVCVAVIRNPKFPPRHFFFDTYDEAYEFALDEDEAGHTVYMAQSSYLTDANRKTINVAAVRSFWMDIDCGPDKPYADIPAGAAALREFLIETGLPRPHVVISGGGLYAHWCISEDMPLKQWQGVSRYLKDLAAECSFAIDPSRTADAASVLRPPGTTNRKLSHDRPVRLVKEGEVVSLIDFATALTKAGRKKGVKKIDTSKKTKLSDHLRPDGGPPADADKIADKCAQMWKIRDTQGDVDEPYWYAAIGLLRYTADPSIAHEWSKGHPDYSAHDTDAKLRQHEEADIGPTTCEHFSTVNPSGCVGCKQKVKSPIVLGRPDPEPVDLSLLARLGEKPKPSAAPAAEKKEVTVTVGVASTQVQIVDPATGFTMAEDGLWFKSGDINTRFYDQLLYPVLIAYDESLGYETITLRHHTAHDGVNDFTVRSASVHDQKGLMQVLADNHVMVVGNDEKVIMRAYLESYAQKLQRRQRLVRLMSQMGWKTINDTPAFVLGRKIFHADGSVDEASLAANVPSVAKAFRAEGSMEKWVEATEVLGKPGMEPFAFALLAGAFGAPVLKFTGFEGAMVSLVGPSGAGKTMVTRWAQSAYGDHTQLLMLRDDTRNSLITRLGLYGSLPLTIDEITNIDPAELSDLVYRVTQGRDKARLNRSAVERSNINHWNTLALVSTNMPLVDKLAGHKTDASAEINRVFEYRVEECEHFSRKVATAVYRTITDNFGGVGEAYIHYLVQHTDEHMAGIDAIASEIDSQASLDSDERYWAAITASAIYGGHIARRLGLIAFDVEPVMQWVINQLGVVKDNKHDVVSGYIDVLGMFLDEHAANRVVVHSESRKQHITLLEPRGQLVVRIEHGNRFIYISRSAIRSWCGKRGVSYSAMRADLTRTNVLHDANARRSLGAGTNYAGSSQPCWSIDIQAPAMGGIGVALKSETEELARLGKGGR